MLTRYFRAFFFMITGNPGVRFRKNDKPTEQSFSQLFDSIGFLKEKDDTSTISTQGFTKISSDLSAQNRDSTLDADGFAKGLNAHMLPNVISGKNIVITPQINATGRTGGTGKDFLVDNDMLVSAAATIGNPIIVNQALAGDDVTIDFDQSILTPLINCASKVLTEATDPTCDYFPTKIDIPENNVVFPFLPHDRLNTVTNATSHKLEFYYKDKIGEVTAYWAPTPLKFTTDFVAGYGQGQWKNWVICDGGIYNDSLGAPVTTPDMRGTMIMGYGTGGTWALGKDYVTIGSPADSALTVGQPTVTLAKGQLPKHNHELTNGTDGSTAATGGPNVQHNHQALSLPFGVQAGNDYLGGDGSTSGTGFDSPAHSHALNGHTGDGTTDGLMGDAHENRPPFIVLVHVMFIG